MARRPSDSRRQQKSSSAPRFKTDQARRREQIQQLATFMIEAFLALQMSSPSVTLPGGSWELIPEEDRSDMEAQVEAFVEGGLYSRETAERLVLQNHRRRHAA